MSSFHSLLSEYMSFVNLEAWLHVAALVVCPTIGVLVMEARDAEGDGCAIVVEEAIVAVGHPTITLIVERIKRGIKDEVILAHSAVIPYPLQPPCACERATQFHVLPVGVALLAVNGDELAGLPFAHTVHFAVGLECEALEVTLRVADVLVVPRANDNRPVLLIQLHRLLVCLRVGVSWLIAAARGEGESSKEKE